MLGCSVDFVSRLSYKPYMAAFEGCFFGCGGKLTAYRLKDTR